MKKFGNYLLTILLLCFIFGIGVYMQLSEKEEISFYENRALAKSPEVSLANVLDGTFTKEYETFFTDHFYEKGEWVKGYIQWQRLTGQTFIQDYYISNDDWIYPKPVQYTSFDNIDKTVANLKELADYTNEKDMELFLFSLPNRYLILDPVYPPHVTNGLEYKNKEYYLNELSKVEDIQVVDVAQQFREKFTHDELKDLYYQTDHHWNADGAFEGYKTIYNTLNEQSEVFNEPKLNEESFNKSCYNNQNFIGSYNRQLYELIDTKDIVCTMMPTDFDFNNLQVYRGAITKENEVDWKNIYGKDLTKDLRVIDYAGIFTSDFKEINIINPEKKDDGSKVLFIKDSYANPMSFWLSQHFYQSTFYDMRYNSDRTLYEYLDQNEFDMIVFLYNDTTIMPQMYDFNLEEKVE